MKALFLILATGFFGNISAQHGNSAEAIPAGKEFNLVYVEGTSPGLSEKLKSVLSDKLDSISTNPFLLYISNSMVDDDRKSDYYTKSKTSISKRLSKLDDESLPRPDIAKDKKFLWSVMSKEDMSVYSQIGIHLYFTTEYMYDYFLKESTSCMLLNFLPKELSLVAKNAPVTITVYVTEPDPKKATVLRNQLYQRVMFKNEGLFESKGLKCNIVVQ